MKDVNIKFEALELIKKSAEVNGGVDLSAVRIQLGSIVPGTSYADITEAVLDGYALYRLATSKDEAPEL
jgi:hypothetical protein